MENTKFSDRFITLLGSEEDTDTTSINVFPVAYFLEVLFMMPR